MADHEKIEAVKRMIVATQKHLDELLDLMEMLSPTRRDEYWTVDCRYSDDYEARVASIHEDNDE